MKKAQDIARLRHLTDMVLQAQLTQLKAAAALRQETLDKIDAICPAPAMMDETFGASGAIAALRYQTWAEARRTDLRQILAKQTADWLDARDNARTAFGKAQGFEKVSAKLATKK